MKRLFTYRDGYRPKYGQRIGGKILAAVFGGVLLAPAALRAQQPSDAALCKAIDDFVAQHPEATKNRQTVNVPVEVRESVVLAAAQRKPDSAAALLWGAFPNSTDREVSVAINRMFDALAALPDTAQIERAARKLVDRPSIVELKFAAELPDTLLSRAAVLLATSSKPVCTGSPEPTPPAP